MYAILFSIIVIVVLANLIKRLVKSTNAICTLKKKLHGRTAIVTGGTTGMGLEIATDFANRGAKVIIACPFQEEGDNARELIVEKTGNKDVIFKLLDLASLKSVRRFAEDILNTEQRLDLLMNNAGVGVPGDFLTADGMNFIMQVNYFGHFLLTILLLPLLRNSGTPTEPSRIVNTSSILHRIGVADIENLNKTGYYWFKVQIYGNSKFCLTPFSRELTRKLKSSNIVINNVDPGLVGTRIFDSFNKIIGSIITNFSKHFSKTPWEGAQTAIYVALDTKAGEVSGEFFKNCKLTKAKFSSYNDETAKRIWEESVRLVQLTDDELKKCVQSY